MIWLLLAFAVYPASITTTGYAGETLEIPLLLVGDEPVRISATHALALNEEITLTGSHRVTLTARIRADTPPGNHTSYIYVEPQRQDAVVLATAIPVRVAVHNTHTPARIIPNTHAQQHGLWAALAGSLTALIGLLTAISVRRA